MRESQKVLREVLLETYAVNDRMNQLLLQHLDARAWRAAPPGLKRRERPHDRGHICPSAQQPLSLAEVFRASSQVPCAA